jgi:type IV pilus assembly protein PilN
MAKINLLPWREELRKKRQQDFLIAMGASVGVTCILFGLVYLHIESLKDYQIQRNTRIKDEITMVEKKITEIKEIEEKKAKLNEKITLIQDLQASRPKIVHLFDELRKVTPVGVYLLSLSQKGSELTLVGKSQSNSRVSEYMNAIDKSLWLTAPKLKFVKGLGSIDVKNEESNDFIMTLKQKQDKPKEGNGDNPGSNTTDKPGA